MKEYYDEYWNNGGAGGYATANLRRWSNERHKELSRVLASIPIDSLILDAGCGIGEFTEAIAHSGHRTVGTDVALQPLRLASQRHPQLCVYCVSSIEGSLPFSKNTFQAIWSTEVIEHLMNVNSAISEFHRVLVPGGTLILTTPFHGVVKNLLLAVHGFERHFDPNGPHIRFFTTKSLKELLDKGGFEVTIAKSIGRFYPLGMSHFIVARKVT